MVDKIHKILCDVFHETDGECCARRATCRIASCGKSSPAPFHEGLTMKQFLIWLGFSALIFVFALTAVSEYNSRYMKLVPNADLSDPDSRTHH